jgi:DNA (cytosine-5)-methyltransferase 1
MPATVNAGTDSVKRRPRHNKNGRSDAAMSHARNEKIRAVDLFCGAGGSSWGASQAGVEIVAAYDRWEVAGRVHQDNFPNARFHCVDLDSVTSEDAAAELGKIDLILASPECTNHSPAKGKAERCEKSRETAFHVVRFAEALRPRWIIVENVVNMRRWKRYTEFVGALTDAGYNCREQVLNSSDFGVPQARRRLFVLCDRDTQPAEVKPRLQAIRTAREIINPNGLYPFSPLRMEGRASATLERAERAISELGSDQPFLIVYYGSDHAGGWQSIDRPLRTITTLDRFAYVKPTPAGHVMRMLQPDELKLAMGWPKHFRIEQGTRRDRIKMIGNAVCPNVMRSVVQSLCGVRMGR